MSLPERLPSDTPKSYAALCAYLAMGDDRSLEKLSHQLAKSLPLLKRWSSAQQWAIRARAYDQALLEADERARYTERAARRAAIEESDWATGQALRDRCTSLLAELPRFVRRSVSRIEKEDPETKVVTITEVITLAMPASIGELARALKLASEMQRLAVGEATDIHRLVTAQLDGFLEQIRATYGDDVYAGVLAIAAQT